MEKSMSNATIRISLKTIAHRFPSGSIERTYWHGKWQRERGRNPSLVFGNHRSPRDAFAVADDLLGMYFTELRAQDYSRHDFFWHPEMIGAIQRRTPVDQLPLPCPYRHLAAFPPG